MKVLFIPVALLAGFAANAQSSPDGSGESDLAASRNTLERPQAPFPPPVRTDAEQRPYQKPNPVPLDWLGMLPTPADYPISSWQADEEGVVEFVLEVDANGQPSDCNILNGSGSAVLDERTCEVLMERSAFDPVIDADGNPIAGRFVSAFEWRKREPEFSHSMHMKVQYVVGEDGISRNCRVIEREGEIPAGMRRRLERNPCLRDNAGVPFRDESGAPVEKRVTVSLRIDIEGPER